MSQANIENAVNDYVERRTQMSSRKAAAHVMQTWGVSSLELAEALRNRGLLLVQLGTPSVDEPQTEAV